MGDLAPSAAWSVWRRQADLDEYSVRWDRLEADGAFVHGEAAFVDGLTDGGQLRVLDAGCGMGRVAVELARRGHRVVGVDADRDMLAYARDKPEPVTWILASVADLELDDRFDVIVMAGNVLPFVEPAQRAVAVTTLAGHLGDGGVLVTGASTAPGCGPAEFDRWCDEAGLSLVAAYGTWDRQPYDGGSYRVTVHRAG